MRDLLLLLYCGAVGFVASGIAASFYTLVIAEPARFNLFGGTAIGLATRLIFFALSGPVLVSAYILSNRRAERWPFAVVLAGIGIAVLWSCCLGVVVVEAIVAFRNGFT
jgi:hypothetical protein